LEFYDGVLGRERENKKRIKNKIKLPVKIISG